MRMRGPRGFVGTTVLTLRALAADTRSAHADPVILSGLIFEKAINKPNGRGLWNRNLQLDRTIGPFALGVRHSMCAGTMLSFAGDAIGEAIGNVTIGPNRQRCCSSEPVRSPSRRK